MRIVDVIEKKKHNQQLTQEEIQFFVDGVVDGQIADYQTSALLMAICLNGMDKDETFNLTMSMLNSGEIVDLSQINGITVDKHSTGGVGDSTTLALAPILACCGVYVAKMSGRGLGFSGGTLDKLESIPNLTVDIDRERFIEIVNKVGCAVIGQSQHIAPADKKLYALRDVTATVDCMPLIASSVMSKKLASGANTILLDVKYGSGAFMKTAEDAIELSKLMVEIGVKANKKIGALVTDMSQPLSNYVGNSLEVIGILQVLKNGQSRLRQEITEVGSRLLALSGVCDIKQAVERIDKAIESGEALTKFIQMVEMQGGDTQYLTVDNKFILGKTKDIYATNEGYIESFKTDSIGIASVMLGGGRQLKTDTIDFGVGIVMNAQIADYVKVGDKIATIYHNGKGLKEACDLLNNCINYSDKKVAQHKIATAYITSEGVTLYK